MHDMWYSILEIAFAWLLCAAAAERVAEILADGKIFDWWREALGRWAFPIPLDWDENVAWVDARPRYVQFISRKVHDLFTCGWCLSVWACIAASWFLPGQWWGFVPYDNIVIKIFGLVFLANLLHAIFRLVHRGRVRTYDLEIRLDKKDREDDGL